jgi:hypothetical protein
MSAYKQFLASDVIVTPFEVNKNFTFKQSDFSGIGIDRFLGTSGSFLTDKTTTGTLSSEYQVLVYSSIKELYYSNFLSSSLGDAAQTGSIIPGVNRESDRLVGPNQSTGYYNYLQTSLSQSRFFPTGSGEEIAVFSLPSSIFGTYIKPGSFRWTDNTNDPGTFTDDGEGNIISGSTVVGNIIYQHGMVIFTNQGTLFGNGISDLVDNTDVTCSFQSTVTIYETQYKCTITENDFNYSLNPSLNSGSEGQLYAFATASYFSPYVTTVGLYNDDQELVAVAKVAQPVPTSATTDMSIIVNLDM